VREIIFDLMRVLDKRLQMNRIKKEFFGYLESKKRSADMNERAKMAFNEEFKN